MKLAKQLGYKLIIVLCIMVTFCSFIASAPVYASKVNKDEFYYSGVQKGSYTVEKSFVDKLIETLEAILDYLLGLCTMGVRMVFVGWTALFERCLTMILKGAVGEPIDVEGASATNLFSADGWVTLDAIFFNHVPLLDINFFNLEMIEGYNGIGQKKEAEAEVVDTENHHAPRVIYIDENGEEVGSIETKVTQGEKTNLKSEQTEGENKNLVLILKEAVAGWYYVLRTISIMVMLVLLMYIGIQLAIKSSASDKAVYKKMLTDWLVGMILVFSIHYIMLFIITFNETLVTGLEKLRTGSGDHVMEVYEYGLEERAQKPLTNEELELTLYDEVKTRAYDVKLTVGTTGMVMYMVLVYYAWKYTFIYLKRYLSVAVLIIMAPLVAVSYAYNKVRTGKAVIFSKWLKEFAFIVILQSIHALIYLVFVQTALTLSLASISGFILSLVLLNFMSKAEQIFRKIFGITGGGAGGVDDISAGAGLKDTLSGLKNTMVGIAGAKVAVAYTKGVAKIATKPLRAAGAAGINAGMRRRAARLDNEAEEYAKEHGLTTGKNAIHDYDDLRKALRKRRTNALHFGGMLKLLDNGDIDVEELEKAVNTLEEGDVITNEYGQKVGIVDASYIKSKRKELDEFKSVLSMTDEQKDLWREEYNALHDKNGKLKRKRIYLSDKWQDIMDPSRYTEKQRDKDGKVILKNGKPVYKTIETKGEYGTIHGKHFSWRVGKRVDSASQRLAKQLKLSNIMGLNKEEKKALEAQVQLLSKEVYGFLGILVGMPLLVAEPTAGMVAMSAGINGMSTVLSSKGSRERRPEKYKRGVKGSYTFKRFEGKSEHTIAEGAKVMARNQAEKVAVAEEVHNSKLVNRMKTKFPKIEGDLRLAANTGAALSFVTVGTMAASAGVPAFVAAAGAAGSAKLTGSIINRVKDNAWLAMQTTLNAAAKADRKAREKDEKDAHTSDYMDVIAEQYFEMEHQQYVSDAKRHAEQLGEDYALLMLAMQKKVDEKTDEEVLRDSKYEEPIEVIKKPDGKKQLAGDAENKLIDNAIIECAQKSGIMDVSEINVEDKMADIQNILETELITRGIIRRDEKADAVIEALETKVKDRKVKIEKSGKGKQVVEEKMAGDAIVSVMQEQGITDPTKVSDNDVLQKFTDDYQKTALDSMKSSQQSNAVLEGLNAQKPQADTDAPKAIDLDAIKASATVAIQARKASFADKSKQKVDSKASKMMRETLKKKQEVEIDKKIMAKEEELENAGIQGVVDTINAGGIAPITDNSLSDIGGTSSDDIIKMLQLQTQLYQDKQKAEMVLAKRDDRVKVYKAMMATKEGTRKFDESRDGSRRVGGDTVKIESYEEIKKSTEVGNVLKRKKQEIRK